ncbi:hypothetical protein OHA40_00925 [Nocardia sp. NBC_00508]|uniref:hypothetical protein n=1 Tax=Nocardia sp. NBC_00508 TaxID=2975992 RepID=UPI002E824241|nr:hypothetical protein [Nocardia sp. NBC_00508]WUD66768.1 hypothetical protein OHA40_00925 [Nocardia sp. NBC_00508]
MYIHGYASLITELAAQPSSSRAVPLLEPEHLLQAISGRCDNTARLVGWARDLSDLHAELIHFKLDRELLRVGITCEQVRARIEEVVDDINVWAARYVPRTKGARKHTHSLGEVINHIAKTFAEAWWTVLHSAEAEERHQAWFHLCEAREGYAEMVDQIRERRLQLPLGWRRIG